MSDLSTVSAPTRGDHASGIASVRTMNYQRRTQTDEEENRQELHELDDFRRGYGVRCAELASIRREKAAHDRSRNFDDGPGG